MKNSTYRNAMDHLPFSDNFEAKTIALLEASSESNRKEMEKMKKNKFSHWRKHFTIGGSVLAAAACLLLVALPLLQNEISHDRLLAHTAEVNQINRPVVTVNTVGGAAHFEAPADAPADAEWDGRSRNFGAFPEEAASPLATSYSAYAPVQWNTEEYSRIQENRFHSTKTTPLSTFAADVDTASYAKLRSAILAGDDIPSDSVRIEEMLNYFHYDYTQPKDGEPFGVTTEAAPCPWNKETQLLLVGLQAKEIDVQDIPPQNLVFLIDVSGSMDEPNKLPLVKRSFKLLLEELRPTDTISIVTYASSDRIMLDGVSAKEKTVIMAAIDEMDAGGSTAGAAGIQTAYALAKKNFIRGGNNRIILATDGDFNVGVSDEGSLTRLAEENRKDGVFLTVLGYGYGNYKDNKLEALADHGNGNYAYIDTIHEARKALVEEIGGTFLTVAKDVKLQVEFNPAKIKGYRLVGYENRTMAAEDFADDTKDGGELGSGHRVTVLYEIVPVDSPMVIDAVETRYQPAAANLSDEWLTVSVRAKEPDGDTSKLYGYPVDASVYRETMSDNMRFAAAVAEFGMLLRNSEFKGSASYDQVLELLRGSKNLTGDVYKEELLYLVSQAQRSNP